MNLEKIRQKKNKQNKKEIPKKILEKKITQIKQPKTAGYLDTKGEDKIKKITCLYLEKIRQKNNQQNKK